jgi:large subunit ribosomal protein L23
MEIEKVIKYPLSTEKSIRLMESENKLIFVVEMKAKKPEIKKAIEKTFKVKVEKVTTLITPKGQKRAYVKLSPETPALDVATDLGLM